MGSLIKSELYKLRKSRSFWLIIFVLTAWPITVLSLDMYYDYVDNLNRISAMDSFLNAIDINHYYMKIALCVFAGFFIAGEYSTGVIKTLAASGLSRGRIYIAKLIVFSFGAIVLSLLFPIFFGIIGALLRDFDSMSLLYLVRTFSLLVLYATGFASVIMAITILFNNSTKAIVFSGLFVILGEMITGLFGRLSEFVPLFSMLYNYSIFEWLYHIQQVNMDAEDLLIAVLVPIGTFIIFAVVGILLFSKKEIK